MNSIYLVTVKPGSARDEVIDQGTDLLGRPSLLVRTREKPIDGEANESVIRQLAEYFDIPRRRISIQSGHTSRTKLICISHD